MNFTSLFYIKIRKCDHYMIANETTIYQSSKEVDVSNYRQLYGLQQ